MVLRHCQFQLLPREREKLMEEGGTELPLKD